MKSLSKKQKRLKNKVANVFYGLCLCVSLFYTASIFFRRDAISEIVVAFFFLCALLAMAFCGILSKKPVPRMIKWGILLCYVCSLAASAGLILSDVAFNAMTEQRLGYSLIFMALSTVSLCPRRGNRLANKAWVVSRAKKVRARRACAKCVVPTARKNDPDNGASEPVYGENWYW